MSFITESSSKNEFLFRLANASDVPIIIQLMALVKKAMPQKEWFVDDNEEYLQHLLDGHGFILLAEDVTTQSLAAFFMVKFPGLSEDNLGYHLDFSEEKLLQCVHMDSCVVHPDFRGQHLQSRMALLAEQYMSPHMPALAKQHMNSHMPTLAEQHMNSHMPVLAELHMQPHMPAHIGQQPCQMPYRYLLATVHPENCYSLNSMLRCGYHVMKKTYLYGGLPRVIILKDLEY